MNEVLKELYETVEKRKKDADEGSYTAYLFEQGIDKILKKIGEESAEVIIAAKNTKTNGNEEKEELINEICDLFYHVLVLMAERNIPLDDVNRVLEERSHKTSNLKKMKKVDKNT